jgi:3-hydroxyacyl-CoA dehydrogenase
VLAVILPVVNEACRVVDEHIVVRPSDVDIATIFGYGFPPHQCVAYAPFQLGLIAGV